VETEEGRLTLVLDVRVRERPSGEPVGAQNRREEERRERNQRAGREAGAAVEVAVQRRVRAEEEER